VSRSGRGRDERVEIKTFVRVPDIEVLRESLVEMRDDTEFELSDLVTEIIMAWCAERRTAALPPPQRHSRPSIRLKASA
jgi:hypothetical protein